jgi:hypothetical protein
VNLKTPRLCSYWICSVITEDFLSAPFPHTRDAYDNINGSVVIMQWQSQFATIMSTQSESP